jgi:hypothetical protein
MRRWRRLVALRRRHDGRQVDPGRGDLVADDLELLDGAVAGVAPEDRVRVAEDTEQRPAASAIFGRSLDQARNLDELDEHAAEAGSRRYRTRGGERVVAGADLDRRQRLQE